MVCGFWCTNSVIIFLAVDDVEDEEVVEQPPPGRGGAQLLAYLVETRARQWRWLRLFSLVGPSLPGLWPQLVRPSRGRRILRVKCLCL